MWAFSDESERGNRMFLAVVFVLAAFLDGPRAELRKLLLPGQRSIHTRLESPRRRRVLLNAVANLDATAVVFRLRRSTGTKTEARRRLLTAAGAEARNRGAIMWVLDDVDFAQRARDRQAIQLMLRDLAYDHRPGRTEPLLWVADAICWAVGAGSDWRRRISAVIELRDMS